MHNISIEHLKELWNSIQIIDKEDITDKLIRDLREIYDTALLLKYQNQTSDSVTENEQEAWKNLVTEDDILFQIEEKQSEIAVDVTPEINEVFETETKAVEKPNIVETHQESIPEAELSVEDRIKAIMEKAASIHQQILPPQPEVKFTKEPENQIANNENQVTSAPEVKQESSKISLEEEMKVSYSAQMTADIFDKAEKITPVKKSLNDKLLQENIQIGLNDRIAFVKHLFNSNLNDFSRVVSQLNSFQSFSEATDFIENVVKKDYDWKEQEEYEQRFLQLVERKFS